MHNVCVNVSIHALLYFLAVFAVSGRPEGQSQIPTHSRARQSCGYGCTDHGTETGTGSHTTPDHRRKVSTISIHQIKLVILEKTLKTIFE